MNGTGRSGSWVHSSGGCSPVTGYATSRPSPYRLLARGQPLDPAAVAAAPGGDVAGTPLLGRRPGDHVGAVGAVVAVRLEAAVGVAAPADIDVHQRVGACISPIDKM